MAAFEPWAILGVTALLAISFGAWRLGRNRSPDREPRTR
jgi:hypothetical protein